MSWELFAAVLCLFHSIQNCYGHVQYCRVTVFNYKFTDCNSTYWKGVTFKLGETKVFKSMEDVCTQGSKTFTAEVEDACFVKNGELSIYLQDKRSHLKPDFKEWWIEKVMVNCSEARFSRSMTIGIGRKIESGRIYRFENFDTFVNYPQYMFDQKIQDLTNNRQSYQKNKALGVGPKTARQLSKEDFEGFMYFKKTDIKLIKEFTSAKKILFANVTAENMNFRCLKEVEEFFDGSVPIFPRSKRVKHWREDKWFAAQRIEGVEPNVVSLIDEIPPDFKLNVSRAERIFEDKLESMLKNGRIYIADLEDLKNFPEYIWSPMVLFYLTKDNTLMPLAIQLQRNNTFEEVFYPDDSTYSWLLAKMYYNVAEATQHQVISHLSYLHIVNELIGTAMFRNIHPSHPVYKLLKPHYYLTYARNIAGIYILLDKGRLMDSIFTGKKEFGMKLFIYGMNRISYQRMNPVLYDKIRRTDNIKNYPYRERASDLYNVIQRYVDGIIRNYYFIDEDVANDQSLRNFRLMLSLSQDYEGVGIKNLPGCDFTGKMTTENLVDIISSVIFQVTVGHTSLTSNAYDEYGFFPNYPLKMNKGPPKATDKIMDESAFMSYLPNKEKAFEFAMAAIIVSYEEGSELGYTERPLLFSPQDQAIVKRWQNDLKVLKKKQYPESPYPYPYLNINLIKNSIRS